MKWKGEFLPFGIKQFFFILNFFYRKCCITFDELHIDPSFCYDALLDQIHGSQNQALVAYARGVFSKWKVPVFYGYNIMFDKTGLEELLRALNHARIDVVALCCDNAGPNRGLWMELGVNELSTSFVHPDTLENVYCIADPVHLLKLVRNNLFDHG